VVQRNRLFDTGGSSVSQDFMAIYSGSLVDFLDNTISGVVATTSSNGYAYGMFVVANNVRGNRISGLVPDGTGLAKAISMNTNERFFLTENYLIGDGITGSIGLDCLNPGVGRSKDNVIAGFDTGINNCGDAGGNDVTP